VSQQAPPCDWSSKLMNMLGFPPVLGAVSPDRAEAVWLKMARIHDRSLAEPEPAVGVTMGVFGSWKLHEDPWSPRKALLRALTPCASVSAPIPV